ncbi:ABC transporter ATP-binding protein [Soehngenia longivitae]|uniref:ABC transporter ATP-binding protein n=1 Tax=Soehngenia longivitae TaxID=2562294 RepID=A0A4Z0D2D8_9FIRM|nr:ABC transporter ATP-binding protein [Soehngenia longivitae]TFZ39505.1 ABC transporter ATP-binding protein [Soehngenia longivitae]
MEHNTKKITGIHGPHSIIPVEKPKDSSSTLKRLFYYFGEEKNKIFIALFLVILSTFLTLLVPYFTGKIVDALTVSKDMINLLEVRNLILYVLAFYVFSSLFMYFQEFIIAGISQRVVYKIRKDIFDKFQKMPVIFFDRTTHGELMSRVTNDIDNINNTISQTMIQFMHTFISTIGTVFIMFYINKIMALVTLATVPIVLLVTRTIANNTKKYFKTQQQFLGNLNGHIEESISGIDVVRMFNKEDDMINKFKRFNDDLKEVGVKAQIWSGFIMPIMNAIGNLTFVIIVLSGSLLVLNNAITIGVVTSFIFYSKQFQRPINELASTFNQLQSGIAGAERVFEILDEEDEREDELDAIEADNIKGKVEFKNVYFNYSKNKEVLKDISFMVEAGTKVALVGPTGAGKTTIVNLLTNFYEVTKGEILIDDMNINKYKKNSLRNMFGVVLQDTYLFSGTIKENIRYGKLDATEEEIIAACKISNADEFIKRLPNGYDTYISEGGGNLSQGQRQLLAIARAVLKDPSILILDEATSNVDTRTELKIQEAMISLMKNRTTFIIAHRLSTIRDADIIMMIEDGRIIEKGTHEELIETKGAYFNLYMSQYLNTAE